MGINEFMQKFVQDKEFAAWYQSFRNLDDALEAAKNDGYSITKEEALAALRNTKSGELSDEELASVAGGKGGSVPAVLNPCPDCGGPTHLMYDDPTMIDPIDGTVISLLGQIYLTNFPDGYDFGPSPDRQTPTGVRCPACDLVDRTNRCIRNFKQDGV